jgi:hypothetical protein
MYRPTSTWINDWLCIIYRAIDDVYSRTTHASDIRCLHPDVFSDIQTHTHMYTYLSNSMELSHSWDATNYAATQEFHNFCGPNVHCRVQKSRSRLSQINPLHTTPSYLSDIRFIITHRPTSWSSFLFIFFLAFQPVSNMRSLHSPFVLNTYTHTYIYILPRVRGLRD